MTPYSQHSPPVPLTDVLDPERLKAEHLSLWTSYGAALAGFHFDRYQRLACRHVATGARAVMCAAHPAAGLFCHLDIGAHLARHHVPTICVWCGQWCYVPDPLKVVVHGHNLDGHEIRDTWGRRHRLSRGQGPVLVGLRATCLDCTKTYVVAPTS